MMAKLLLPLTRTPALLMALFIAGCATPTKPPVAPGIDPLRLGNPKAEFTVMLRCAQPALNIGAPVRLDFQTAAPGYLNLYFIHSSGQTGQLLTNYPVQANEPVTFPPAGGKKLRYAPGPPAGAETFILAATRQPLNLLGRADIKNVKKPRTPVAELNLSGPQLVNRLRSALQQRPPADWNAVSIRTPLLSGAGRP